MTPLAAAIVALLVAEHVAPAVAEARVAAIVAACEAAAPGDAFMVALCSWNAFQESRMDPDPCRHDRDADGRPTCDRLVLAVRGSQAATKLGPPRAIGPWQIHRVVALRLGSRDDPATLDGGARLFVESLRYWRARTPTWEAALSSHMVGHERAAGRKGRARVRWARRFAP